MLKNQKFTNLFVVSITEFLMMRLSLIIIKTILTPLKTVMGDVGFSLIYMALFIIPIILCLVYMKMTCPDKLKTFVGINFRKSMKTLGIGLSIGFGMNALLCALAYVSGSVKYSWVGFDPLLIVAVFACFIQCSAEEVLIRGYASSYLDERYSTEVAAFVGSILFVLHHIGNLTTYGFNLNFCLSVFLFGILCYLSVKLTKGIWMACGIHTAWNYTQSFIFGSRNSGKESLLTFFVSYDEQDTFFASTAYGNEATGICVVVILVATVIMYLVYRQQNIRQGKGVGVIY